MRTAPKAQPLRAALALICPLILTSTAFAQPQETSPTVVAFIDGTGIEVPAASISNEVQLEDLGQRICFVDTSTDATPVTPIRFTVAKTEELVIEVFNPQGEVIETVASGVWSRGTHTLGWFHTDSDGHGVEEGVYVIRLRTPSDGEGVALGTD